MAGYAILIAVSVERVGAAPAKGQEEEKHEEQEEQMPPGPLLFPSLSSATVQPTLPCKDTIVGPQTMYLALIVLRRGGRGKFIFSVSSSSCCFQSVC